MTFALVASEMGGMGALSILSKMFLATLFARHAVLPSALQTLDWTRSTLSLPANKEFTANIEKKCDQTVERVLVNPIKPCARSCKYRWLDILKWTRQRFLQQAASVRYTIEHQLDHCARVSQQRRRLSKKYKTVLGALAIRWYYRYIEAFVWTVSIASPDYLPRSIRTNSSNSSPGASPANMQQDTAQHDTRPKSDSAQDHTSGRYSARHSAPNAHSPSKTHPLPKPESSPKSQSFPRTGSGLARPPPPIQTGWRNTSQPNHWRQSPTRQCLGSSEKQTGLISPKLRRKTQPFQLRASRKAPPPPPPLRPKKGVRFVHDPVVSPTTPMNIDSLPPSPEPTGTVKDVTVAQLYELRDELIGIECSIAEMSSQPSDRLSLQTTQSFLDAYQAAFLDLSSYRDAADLRILDQAFFDSMIDSLESAFLHLQTIMTSFLYDQDWIDLYNAVFEAATDVADELRALRVVVAAQISKRGHIQEAATIDGLAGRPTNGEV